MIDLSAVRAEFKDLNDIRSLGVAPSGQKDVLRARLNDEDVVLKIIKPSANDAARAEREIAAVARLNCPYVPKVFEHGHRAIGGEDRYYLVEQYIAGVSYREQLVRQPVQPLVDVVRLGEVLLGACVEFEAQRLVHRDIKPENIMVDGSGKFWIIDFGIVRMLDAESLTATSQRFGPCTPGYGAPEQFRNDKKAINAQADLFSVGVVLYESLAGAHPFGAGRRAVLDVIRAVDSTDVPRLAIPGDKDGCLAELICSLAGRFPSRRPPTAVDAFAWFREVQQKLGTI